MRIVLLFLLIACREDKHSLPAIKSGSDDPIKLPSETPAPAVVDTSTLSGRLRGMFGATQSPDVAGTIAKLEAQRATMPVAERKLVDRTIALMRSGEAAMAEHDREKSRQLRTQLMRDSIALLDDMAALSPDDLDLITMVASSFHIMAAQIESLDVADELSPRTVKAKARALADRMIKVHANAAKAWSLHASVTPYTDREGRLRDFARCVKLEPSNASCKDGLDRERADYVRPYCEGVDLRPVALEWREVSLKPTAGATPIEHHYETYYMAPTAKFTFKDVVRVQAGETTSVTNRADGKVDREVLSTVHFELAPGKLDAMMAWSRALEKREDGYALLQSGKLLFVDRRAMWDDSTPGISNAKIDAYCSKTTARTLPLTD